MQAESKQAQPAQQDPATTYATPTADQLYQLVAPIALFPDNLVAQVLAASTYPDEVTDANTWLHQNSKLKGEQLMQAADKQPWDESVKGLTQFADVLNQMATNLSWTSALGDAYFNIPQSVMNAVQVMRDRAYKAGNLKTSQQQDVTVQNQTAASAPSSASQPIVVTAPPQTIVIQPAQPEVVYVPTYNPTVVYGAPVAVYPGYSTGALVATSLLSFGVGVAVGAAVSGGGCCGWGWNSWGVGWRNSTVIYNHNTYVSRSNTFVNRNNYYGRNNTVNNLNRNTNYNRNNNYRANNFNNNARPGNVTTPKFNQKYNQPQINNNHGNLGQNNRQPPGANSFNSNRGGNLSNSSVNNNRGNLGQKSGQPLGGANQNRPNTVNQAQRQPARGYGQQANRGTSSGAFSNYSAGGNARTNSARGGQSLGGNRGGGGGSSSAAARGRRGGTDNRSFLESPDSSN